MRLMKSGITKNRLFLILCALLLTWIKNYSQIVSENNYQRSSVIHMMIEHPMYMFNIEIANAFKQIPLSNRFNNHDLGVKVVKFATQEYIDQETYISSFIKQTKLGNRAIAKWFSWDKVSGKFNMSLVQERGLYNANAMEYLQALKSIRGNSILKDAGENLIPNTYLLMSDICYSGIYSNKENLMNLEEGIHKFDVKIVTYIYQLVWNEDSLYSFYEKYYHGSFDFINHASIGFVFRAKVETSYGEESINTTQSKLIEKVVARCLDINIAKLQKVYPDFRIKAIIASVDPIQADIGLKEGITANDEYEVLEKEIDKDGIISLRRVAIIKPIDGKIKDNRYMASEYNDSCLEKFTTFIKISGKDIHPGMLIRELN